MSLRAFLVSPISNAMWKSEPCHITEDWEGGGDRDGLKLGTPVWVD